MQFSSIHFGFMDRLGASYFLGYLAVVALLPWLAPKLGCRRLCVGGLGMVAASLSVANY